MGKALGRNIHASDDRFNEMACLAAFPWGWRLTLIRWRVALVARFDGSRVRNWAREPWIPEAADGGTNLAEALKLVAADLSDSPDSPFQDRFVFVLNRRRAEQRTIRPRPNHA